MTRPATPLSLRPARIIAVLAVLAGLFVLGPVSFASADATDTIANPFFKADTPGTGLSGWQTTGTIPTSYLSDQGISCNTAAGVSRVCAPETGKPVAIAGTYGAVAPQQANLLGSAGVSGKTFRYRPTDIYSSTSEADIFGQSNFAITISGCNSGVPGTTTLSSSPFAGRANDVLYGWSFFSSNDWWPDSGNVMIVGPNGQATTVFQSEITSSPNPAGSWDHPVLPGPAPPDFPN